MCRVASTLSLWALILGRLRTLSALPTLNYPVNSQLPPVAYTEQAYTFTFAEDTFDSDDGPLTYTIASRPLWLQLDPLSRTISGTPSSQDVGSAVFQLVAADQNGNTASTVTLVVLEAPQIQLGVPVLPQLAKAGRVSAPSSLLLPPLQAFVLPFAPTTFLETTSSTTFYALSANGTPLPSWLQFSADTLTFSGLSPPFVSSSTTTETFGIQLIASDVVGFAQATLGFEIVVSQHQLSFEPTTLVFNATPGQSVTTPPLIQDLTLDNVVVEVNQLVSKTFQGPDWLTLDQDSLSLTGFTPTTATNTIVTISVTDNYGDVANATITFAFASNSGSTEVLGPLDPVNATIGHIFEYVVPLVDSAVPLPVGFEVDLKNASTWLIFSTSNRTIHGFVPVDLMPEVINIQITAKSNASVDTGILTVNVVSDTPSAVTSLTLLKTSTRTLASTGPTVITTGAPHRSSHAPSKRITIIIVLTLILSVLAATLVIFCLCCYHRRRKVKAETPTPEPGSVVQPPSEPGASDDQQAIQGGHSAEGEPVVTPAGPPQVQLLWPPGSFAKHKRVLSRKRSNYSRNSEGSDWGGLVHPVPWLNEELVSQIGRPGQDAALKGVLESPDKKAHEVVQDPSIAVVASPRVSQNNRASRGLSIPPNRSSGLAYGLSGVGHGAGVLQVSPDRGNRTSWQTTFATIPDLESKPVPGSPDTAPLPPSMELSAQSDIPDRNPSRLTVRRVPTEFDDHGKSFELQRQNWHTSRARDRLEGTARFPNAPSSQSLSESRKFSGTRGSPGRSTARILSPQSVNSRNLSQPSWSGWSGVSPAARGDSTVFGRTFTQSHARGPSKLGRTVSTVSSRQFESAASSEVDWEDEGLVEEQNTAGRHWRMAGEQPDVQTPSPRLPFQLPSSSQERVNEDPGSAGSRKAQLADDRKQISIKEQQSPARKAGQRASFSFI